MNLFPTINHISDLLPYIEGNKQFRVQEQPNGFTVACYMVKDEDTFRGEHSFWYQECRGITFNADGTVASRTLHKFPNVGENAESQPDMIPWDRIVRIMDKRDGSMITPVLMADGSIVCKTKKTFTSAEAVAATEWLHQIVTDADGNKDQPYLEWCREALASGFTPTFEWTSPRFPIVLVYEKDELTLLQIRENVTGEYITNFEDDILVVKCPFQIVENLAKSYFVQPRKLLDVAMTTEGVEGWIIQADDGQMWKIKTKWYCDLHHSVTFTRYRDVARAVLAEKSDDLKAAFAQVGRSIEPIVEVERLIFAMIDEVQRGLESDLYTARTQDWDAKKTAIAFKDHRHFGLLMRTFRHGEINWMEWYQKEHIRDHSLEVIPQAGMDDIVEVEDDEV